MPLLWGRAVKQISRGITMIPEKMTLIINIQTMRRKAGLEEIQYWNLESMSIERLRKMQDELIPIYNKAVKR
jgi:hypothetical protein